VRLDHLLSKEHLTTVLIQRSLVQAPIRTERVRRLAHGWNIDSAVVSVAADLSTPAPSGVGWNGWVVGVGGWCTLLGPEGPGFPVVVIGG
jgi:hypothetical protein